MIHAMSANWSCSKPLRRAHLACEGRASSFIWMGFGQSSFTESASAYLTDWREPGCLAAARAASSVTYLSRAGVLTLEQQAVHATKAQSVAIHNSQSITTPRRLTCEDTM
jgi:hypothetical protein